MASYTTIVDWKDVEDGYVVAVTIRQTDAETYPSGWDYSLHLGEVGGETLLRVRQRARAHERPRASYHGGVEIIEFPGMLALYERFKREAEEMAPVSWGWPE